MGNLSMARRKCEKGKIEKYREIKCAFFYYNNEDSNLFVPKLYGIGWTVNWANPISWVIILIIIILVILPLFLKG